MSPELYRQLGYASLQTLEMIGLSSLFAVLGGLPLGVLLYLTRESHLSERWMLHRSISLIVNVIRSIPFIILLVVITPLTRWIVGTSIGTLAAMVPLAIAAIPFYARIVESALAEVPLGVIEAATAMGASLWQVVWLVLLPEARPGLIRGVTLTLITLVGYSAMAGAVGGGGLGDFAIRFGYQRFMIDVMFWTVLLLIGLVQVFQWLGDYLARRLTH